MNAAKLALEDCSELFPHLSYQRRLVKRSFKQQEIERRKEDWKEEVRIKREELGINKIEAAKWKVGPARKKP